MQKSLGKNRNIFNGLDCLFRACKEKIEDNGEDSFCYCVREDSLLLGVFDGCGGSGAKRYTNYSNKTGAYIGARAAAGAVQSWFETSSVDASAQNNAEEIHQSIQNALRFCKAKGGSQGETKLKGSIAKEFPTTAAVAYCVPELGSIRLDCYWAGDSRVYVLDEDGLAQITRDDLDGLDAFENISGDGVLTNVISATKPFDIHSVRLTMQKPFLIFAASDGCFGYIPTPMEFEAYVLNHLLQSKSMTEFEKNIYDGLEKIAGDDYSLVGAAFGFGTYSNLQASVRGRFRQVMQQYIRCLQDATPEGMRELWESYRENYERFLERRYSV